MITILTFHPSLQFIVDTVKYDYYIDISPSLQVIVDTVKYDYYIDISPITSSHCRHRKV